MNSFRIIECFQIFKNQTICMIIISNLKPIQPFSLNQGMERLNTCVIPWICLFRITTLHVLIYPHRGFRTFRDSRISIHLMFLFIEEKKDGKSKKSEFQYISCSYLSIVGLHNTTHRGNFNTSHVLIYLLIYARFVCWKDISIHLMFLFIV